MLHGMPENLVSPRIAGTAPERAAAPRRPSWHRRADWLVIAVPAVAALAVGGYRLGAPSLWRDEAYTISAAQRSVGQILAMLRHVDAVHGPYYLGMHFVVSLLGTSAVALRLPSLLGMGIAAGFTAAIGRRLARVAALPAPSVTGLVAGLLFAWAPQTTYYAQDARPYGPVLTFAVIATYLLIRAAADCRWRWWTAYGAAIALTGLFNLFALLLVAAHGVTLLLARMQARNHRPAEGDPAPQPADQPPPALSRWLVVVTAAVAALTPMLYLGYQQGHTLSWVIRPGLRTVARLVAMFAGGEQLIPLVAVIALCGAVAGRMSRHPGELTLTGVTLPWLVLPPLILISVSQVHPVYVERYVVFCLPALALLCAAGLAWLVRLAAATPVGKLRPALAWLPSAVILAALAVLLAGPQQATRQPAARPDNLRAAAAIVSAHERPGDVIFYIPVRTRVLSIAYPGPFLHLRDLALASSPAASDSLVGTQAGPSALRSRFTGVRRVWIIRWSSQHPEQPLTPTGQEELRLVRGMHRVRRWHVTSITISLYATSGSARSAGHRS
jgi:mannosyltransferase